MKGIQISPSGFAAAVVVALFAAICMIPLPVYAQDGFAGAMSGFSSSNNEPIAIEADSLELRDNDKLAIFSGNVMVQQGKTTLRTRQLKVYYTGSAQGAGNQDIDRLEASGGVVVTSGDQRATGQTGVFDARRDTIVLSGNVVLSQGKDVLRGKELHVDLAAGTSRMIAEDQNGNVGRVRAVLTPKNNQKTN